MTQSTSKLIPAEAQRDGRLTVFPLLADGEAQLPYLLLADAMESGTLRITEIGQGTVPALLALNQGDVDVLVLDGEQLIGAKQNRMPNRTILLPAKSETRIPVSCMEQGRWHYRHPSAGPASAGPESADSLRFRHEAQHSPSKIRRHVRNLEAKLAMDGMAAAPADLSRAQSEVWTSVGDYADSLGARSPTIDLDHVYHQRREDLRIRIESFPLVDGQIGLLAFYGERPLGMDVIGGQELFGRLHARLLRGYLMDSLEADATHGRLEQRLRRYERESGTPASGPPDDQGETPFGELDEAAALRFMDAVQKAKRTAAPTVGGGLYHVLSHTVVGGELLDANRLVHQSAFPISEDDATRTELEERIQVHQRRSRYQGPIAGPRSRGGRGG